MLTTLQAADKLNVTRQRVVAMIAAKRIKAEKIGRDWMIKDSELAKVRDRKPGRPRKGGKK